MKDLRRRDFTIGETAPRPSAPPRSPAPNMTDPSAEPEHDFCTVKLVGDLAWRPTVSFVARRGATSDDIRATMAQTYRLAGSLRVPPGEEWFVWVAPYVSFGLFRVAGDVFLVLKDTSCAAEAERGLAFLARSLGVARASGVLDRVEVR